METAKTIIALNKLITINNDRIEGYQKAYDETEDRDLKNLFLGFIRNSQKCKTELEDTVNRLGGDVTEGTMVSGKFFRVWMDVKAALTGNDRKAILDSCEYGEDAAKGTYEKVLKEDAADLSPEQQTMVRTQHSWLKADHDQAKSMRDSLVNA